MLVDDLGSWLQDDWVNRSFDNGVHGHMDGQAGHAQANQNRGFASSFIAIV